MNKITKLLKWCKQLINLEYFKNTLWHNILNISVGIISLIISVLINRTVGIGIPRKDFFLMAIVVIVVVSGLFFLIWHINATFIENMQFDDKRHWKNQKSCDILDRFCCGSSVSTVLAENFKVFPSRKISKELEKEHSLFLQSYIFSLEKRFYKNSGKEIMIISSSLDSEVSLDGKKGASSLVRINLLKGIKYYYFYAENKIDPENVERNIRNIKKQFANNPNINFYSYSVLEDEDLNGAAKNSDLSEYLLYLFGVVIYIYADDTYEAYFSIRQPHVEPIYRHMPICIAGRYITMLKKIITDNEKKHAIDKFELKIAYDLISEEYVLRNEVFIEEQNIDAKDEFVGDEAQCVHCHIFCNSTLIACARLSKEKDSTIRISRVAVKKEYRKKGIGREIMKHTEAEAIKLGYREFFLIAQTHAVGFYKKLGYTINGNEFKEAGIPHITMKKRI